MEYASLTISVIALLVSGYSVYDARRSNRIGHAPAIVGNELESPTEYSYSIKNKGNGPAHFERVEYFFDSQPLEKPFREAVYEALSSAGIRFESTITQLGQQTVMGAGEEILLGRIRFSDEDGKKFRELKSFDIRIIYKSAYGDRNVWATNDSLQNI